MREKDRIIRIIVDTLRQEKRLTSIKPIIDETELSLIKKNLEEASYEQVLNYQEIVKNNKSYFYNIAFQREDEKDLFISRIIEICKVEDTYQNVIEESDVYEKLRMVLESKCYEEVKSLLEIYRRKKTEAFDIVMGLSNCACFNTRLKLI